MHLLPLLIVVSALSAPADSVAPAPSGPTDPAAPPSAASQASRIVITSASGFATSLAGLAVVYGASRLATLEGGAANLTWPTLGLGVGIAAVGPGLTVGLVGNALGGTGSVWAAMGGSLVGGVVGFGVLAGYVLGSASGFALLNFAVTIPLGILVALLPTVGAVLGYELTAHGPPKPVEALPLNVHFGAEPVLNPAGRTIDGMSLIASGTF